MNAIFKAGLEHAATIQNFEEFKKADKELLVFEEYRGAQEALRSYEMGCLTLPEIILYIKSL